MFLQLEPFIMQRGSNLQHKDDPQSVNLDGHNGQIHWTMKFMIKMGHGKLILFYLLLRTGKPLS